MRLEHVRSILLLVFTTACSITMAQTVKVTPLGSHAGELCARDRATIFEDPTGIRILYDAGQSLTGADDPRLPEFRDAIPVWSHDVTLARGNDNARIYTDEQTNVRLLRPGETEQPATPLRTVRQ